jgi:hypothetical protein
MNVRTDGRKHQALTHEREEKRSGGVGAGVEGERDRERERERERGGGWGLSANRQPAATARLLRLAALQQL